MIYIILRTVEFGWIAWVADFFVLAGVTGRVVGVHIKPVRLNGGQDGGGDSQAFSKDGQDESNK